MLAFIQLRCRFFSIKTNGNVIKMKYLNVAEKNDAAKTIAGHLSRGTSRRREGISPYNKIYEFQANVNGTNANMVMTSVSGHLLTHEFVASYRNWRGCDPISLFDAPVRKSCPENYVKVKKTLEREIRSCNTLVIWTDCDREGENIGFEIIDVCRAIKPNINVYRAKFSEMTAAAVKRALATLGPPDEKQNFAVDVRSELDLRIGAAFTRFQTLRFQRLFPSQLEQRLVSYGSCQIPTLGFVTQRFKETEDFIPKPFWKLKLTHTIDALTVEFNWARHRLFDKQCCEAFLLLCQANPTATVYNVTLKPKSKWRPLPMDTITLEKLGSKWLKISAKQTMTIAEKLYTQGLISYPRTETNIFSNEIDLRPLVEQQNAHSDWGPFANKVLQWGPNPRVGKKTDQAHPPIHPTKFTSGLSGDEKKVYELVVRHFLACVSKDATASETIVNCRVADEEFTASGLCIHERNYLEVYVYEKWSSKEVHPYRIGDTFEPTELAMNEGTTTAPSLLTEAELIALMDKHGIGTDATHAEHINTIKERDYIGVIERGLLVPGVLGMGLVEGYDAVDLPLAQPKLRAALERDLKLICTGERDPKEVLREQIQIYKEAFRIMTERARRMDESMASRLQAQPVDLPSNEEQQQQPQFKELFKCPKCQMPMVLKTAGTNNSYVVSCLGYPDCKNSFWLSSDIIKEAIATDDSCSKCGSSNKLVNLKMKNIQMLSVLNQSQIFGIHYKTCFVCDSSIRNLCNIEDSLVKRTANASATITVNRSNHGQPLRSITNNSTATRRDPPARTTSNRSNTTNASNSRGWDLPSSSSSQPFNDTSRPSATSAANPNQTRGWGISTASSPTNSTTTRRDPPALATSNRSNTTNASNSRGWDPPSSTSSQPFNDTSRPSATSAANPNQTRGWGISTASSPTNNIGNTSRAPSNSRSTNNPNTSSSASNNVLCSKCGEPARKLTVRKEGPNTGRTFYACKPECNFFKWGDDTGVDDSHSTSNFPTTSSRGGAGSGGDGNANNRSKRKCGVCRQEGHTRQKCPRAIQD